MQVDWRKCSEVKRTEQVIVRGKITVKDEAQTHEEGRIRMRVVICIQRREVLTNVLRFTGSQNCTSDLK